MSSRAGPLRTPPDIDAVAAHYSRVDRSVRLYYSPANPDYVARFRFLAPDEVTAEREATIDEQAAESALSLLASLEAAFRVDYIERCRRRPRDPLSRAMRDLFNEKGRRARLSKDILRAWRDHTAIPPSLIGEIRAAFRYRHWLAHGRYYPPKFGRAYDFHAIHDLARAVARAFPFLTV